uniref:Cysteine and serine rich nuclear protein 1 n=1 Tax=Hippocampus comes TaxID=109280 RepID=A0A3Q2Y4B7_HIPCM
MAGVLKRKFAAVEESPSYSGSSSSPPSSSPTSSECESDGESSSSETQDFTPHSPSAPTSLPVGSIVKKPRLVKRQCRVRFDQVAVFSFPRCQGFTSVPSHGGATLGMMRQHSSLHKYTVAEHASEQRRRRRQRHLLRLGEERFDASKQNVSSSNFAAIELLARTKRVHSQETPKCPLMTVTSTSVRRSWTIEAPCSHIHPGSGRASPRHMGGRDPACSLAGIKCQVDRFSFPCGCTKDGCGNTEGYVEFDSKRVQTHYIHTVMRLDLERRLRAETTSLADQSILSEELVESPDLSETHPVNNEPFKTYPFGFSLEEDDLALSIATGPTFNFLPARTVVEESSCSSDMTESSSSSADCNGGQLPANHGGAPCSLSICDSENNNYSMCHQLRLMAAPLTLSSSCESNGTTDRMGALSANSFADNQSSVAATDYLDENANQARDPIDNEDSLEDYPNTPSPTVDFSSSRYMDLSLSSESDLEFFDSDYPSGPFRSSFKEHRHADSFHHPQLMSSVYLPQCESSTYLLESLIGLTEPSAEQFPASL